MTLRSDYDTWRQRLYDAAPDHEDASSPWYQLVREHIGNVTGLRILEVACGRGGFGRQLVLIFSISFCRLSWGYFEKPLVKIGHRTNYEFGAAWPAEGG